MFGGFTFLVREHMYFGIIGDELMVRVDPDRCGAALGRRHARGNRVRDGPKLPRGDAGLGQFHRRVEPVLPALVQRLCAVAHMIVGDPSVTAVGRRVRVDSEGEFHHRQRPLMVSLPDIDGLQIADDAGDKFAAGHRFQITRVPREVATDRLDRPLSALVLGEQDAPIEWVDEQAIKLPMPHQEMAWQTDAYQRYR